MPQQNVTVYVSNLPKFSIIMWHGETSDIPESWSLCDGNNGTPDLRNRFIVGAGSSYPQGATGGAATVTLTVDQIPSHSHNIALDNAWQVPNAGDHHNVASPEGGSLSTALTGGGNSHDNMPPYFALYYIMKTA